MDGSPQNAAAGRECAGTLADVRERFLDFYLGQYPKLVTFIRLARGADLPAAEDAAQNAFLHAWRHVKEGRWDEVDAPQAWIRTVALHEHDHPTGSRRIQPQTRPTPDDLLNALFPSAPPPTELSTLVIDTLRALRELDDGLAQAVMAFTLDGFTDGEIAVQLDLDAQRVRNLRKKGRSLLQVRLAAHRAKKGDVTR